MAVRDATAAAVIDERLVAVLASGPRSAIGRRIEAAVASLRAQPGARRSLQPVRDSVSPSSPPVILTLVGPELDGVARLVAGGVAMRLGLQVATIDDLQAAIETALMAVPRTGEPPTVSISVDARRLTVSVGPAAPDALRWELRGGGDGLELGTVLDRLVDEVTAPHDPVSSIGLHVDLIGREA